MQSTVFVWYLGISLVVFCWWLHFFLKDAAIARTDATSWIVLSLASLFWLVTLPVAFLERTRLHRLSTLHSTVRRSRT